MKAKVYFSRTITPEKVLELYRLVGKELGLDPLVTLMALYAGYRLWGFPGLILAPVLAVAAQQLLSARQE